MKPLLFYPYDVLGIDPGPEQSGWMLVRATGGGAAHYVEAGVVPSRGRDFARLLSRFQLAAVAVERPRWHAREASPVAMRAMAQQLVETMYVAARFIERVRACTPPVHCLELPAAVWRKGLLGNGQSNDAAIKRALAPILKLPKRTNAHERDAGGVALAAVRLLANKGGAGPYGQSEFDAA